MVGISRSISIELVLLKFVGLSRERFIIFGKYSIVEQTFRAWTRQQWKVDGSTGKLVRMSVSLGET